MSLFTPFIIIILSLSALTVFRSVHATEVYRCVYANGAVSFSDSPCRQDVQQKITVEPMPIVGWEKVEQPRYKKSSGRRKRSQQLDSNKLADNTSACRKTRSRIEKINSRLRAGYTLKAGERLKENLRELENFRFRSCR